MLFFYLRVNRVKKYQIRSKKKKICYNLVKTLKQFEGWGIMYNTYTIGELAKILGITAETIRYYERKEIIAPIHVDSCTLLSWFWFID